MSLWQRLCTEVGWQGLPLLVLLALVLFLTACNSLCLQRQQFAPPELLQSLLQLRQLHGSAQLLVLARRDESSVLARLLSRCLPRLSGQPLASAEALPAELQAFWELEQQSHLLRCRGLRLCAESAPLLALLCVFNPFAMPVAGGGNLIEGVLSRAQPYLFFSLTIALAALALGHFFEHRLRRLVAETQAQAIGLFAGAPPASLAKHQTATMHPRWQKNHSFLAWLLLFALAGWTRLQPHSELPSAIAGQSRLHLDADHLWRDARGHVQQPSSLMLQTPQPPERIELLVPAFEATTHGDSQLDAVLQQARLLGWRVQSPEPSTISP